MASYPARQQNEPLTIEEFARLPEEDPYRHELIGGRLLREPRPGAQHGALVVELAAALLDFTRRQGIGRVVVDTGFVLFEEPPTVRGPDVAFVSSARIPPEGLPGGFIRGAPDLAIEVVSPSNSLAGMQAKIADYLRAGSLSVWIVEPVTRTITTYHPDGSVRLLRDTEELLAGGILPGFRIRAVDLFDAAR
jgi:Uma2 family endonuclease